MEIDVKLVESHDVDLLKRGFMDVKISQSYNNHELEYDTNFQFNTKQDQQDWLPEFDDE